MEEKSCAIEGRIENWHLFMHESFQRGTRDDTFVSSFGYSMMISAASAAVGLGLGRSRLEGTQYMKRESAVWQEAKVDRRRLLTFSTSKGSRPGMYAWNGKT